VLLIGLVGAGDLELGLVSILLVHVGLLLIGVMNMELVQHGMGWVHQGLVVVENDLRGRDRPRLALDEVVGLWTHVFIVVRVVMLVGLLVSRDQSIANDTYLLDLDHAIDNGLLLRKELVVHTALRV
jgi:hypothetical protein